VPCLQGGILVSPFMNRLANSHVACGDYGLKDAGEADLPDCARDPFLRRIPHVIAGGKLGAHPMELQTVT
jgi:hypothetical protein